MDALTEIKQLYYQATKATIQRDIKRAVELLKAMKSDEERERAAVFMDGLSQMRCGVGAKKPKPGSQGPRERFGHQTRV
jgi:hypothetical protein